VDDNNNDSRIGDSSSEEAVNYYRDYISNYTIVTFGSSRTWGAGIRHPERDSFSALLGARNLGIRASGPEYPALCTYSMLEGNENGDDKFVPKEYDVIVIEYSLGFFETAAQSLPVLAKRLKLRYPNAIIIMLSIWMPKQYRHIKTGYSLDTWIKRECPKVRTENKEFLNCLEEKSISSDWKFYPDFGGKAAMEMIAKSVDGVVVSLKSPREDDDAIDALKQSSYLYTMDMTHFSEEGHRWVQYRIIQKIQEHQQQSSQNNKKVVDTTNVGGGEGVISQPWQLKDYCMSWFQSGKVVLATNTTTTTNSSMIQNTTMPLVEFKEGKFALEASNNDDNSFTISNLFSAGNLFLKKKYYFVYISFMSTSPERIYPKVDVSLLQNGEDFVDHRTINPFVFASHGIPLHLVSHQFIGKIRTDTNKDELTIRIQKMVDDNSQHQQNFRLVGIMITPYHFGTSIKADI